MTIQVLSCGTVYNVVQGGFHSSNIQMKTIEQYLFVGMLIELYKEVLTFKSVDEIQKCDHSNESS